MQCWYVLLSLCLFLAGTAIAQEDEGGKAAAKGKIKPYKEVITKDAVTDDGLFTVHKLNGKYYFELPMALLEDEILVVSRIAGHVKGLNFGGAGMKSRPQQVIRWQRVDDKVLLRSVSYNSVADFNQPIYQSVRNNNFEPVIMAFDIAAFTSDSTGLVFDVTPLFTTDVPMLGALDDDERKEFAIKGLDKSRSLITWMKSFPENTEVRHIMTYNGDKLPDNQLTGTLSVELNQSFILLPAAPMQPRLYDERVGYFSIQQTDYGLDAQRAEKRRYITRWRLEPVDMEAWQRGELVEVKKPIVYYIDPATPDKWRPYIKKGVEDWQKAFEHIGFKNAILAKDPPSKAEDPDWSPEDVRYSVIRYITTDIQNAQGPHVHDPRTGEILESDILWYHNVMNLLRNWYFTQTAAINPEAQKPRFKDEIMGELIRFVSAHEVGHTLGLPHNMGSSVAYPVDSLRSPGFVHRNGTAPSIMDYARFNYIAQPEDGDVGLYPKIGPYDLWAITYGYKPLPEVKSAEAERAILNQWVKERANNPIYRYGAQRGNPSDPTSQTEDLGDDAMRASEYGIANLKRIVPKLVEWSTEEGRDYAELEELYGQVIGQLGRYLRHVSTNVGGVYAYPKTADQDGTVYSPVEKDKQERAVAFLNKHVFATPQWLLDTDILQRIESDGALKRVRDLQVTTLERLLETERLRRLLEAEALHDDVYRTSDLMNDTRKGIFSEVYAGKPADTFRRNLQRAYVDKLIKLVNEEKVEVSETDIPALSRAQLNLLSADMTKALAKISDSRTQAHFLDLQARIKEGLEKS